MLDKSSPTPPIPLAEIQRAFVLCSYTPANAAETSAHGNCDMRVIAWAAKLRGEGFQPVQITVASLYPGVLNQPEHVYDRHLVWDQAGKSWIFHTAPALLCEDGQYYVIDWAWFPSGPAPASQWSGRLGGFTIVHDTIANDMMEALDIDLMYSRLSRMYPELQ